MAVHVSQLLHVVIAGGVPASTDSRISGARYEIKIHTATNYFSLYVFSRSLINLQEPG
jgi:hypothetical protein